MDKILFAVVCCEAGRGFLFFLFSLFFGKTVKTMTETFSYMELSEEAKREAKGRFYYSGSNMLVAAEDAKTILSTVLGNNLDDDWEVRFKDGKKFCIQLEGRVKDFSPVAKAFMLSRGLTEGKHKLLENMGTVTFSIDEKNLQRFSYSNPLGKEGDKYRTCVLTSFIFKTFDYIEPSFTIIMYPQPDAKFIGICESHDIRFDKEGNMVSFKHLELLKPKK